MHNAGYAVLRCLSVTFVYCIETVKDTAIVTMECEQETIPKLSNVTFIHNNLYSALCRECRIRRIFSDLERLITDNLRSHHYLTLNISETVRDKIKRRSYNGILIHMP